MSWQSDKKVLNWNDVLLKQKPPLVQKIEEIIEKNGREKRLGTDKPKRTITKYKVEDWTKGNMPSQSPDKKYESFEEYAKTLGILFPGWPKSTPKKQRKRTKGKITTHGVDRVRVAKQGPKPKRMLRIE